MLAHDVASRFEEWLADQERTRPWSLQGALLEWVRDEAAYWTGESYELYLRTVVIILVNWATDNSSFTYQLDGEEAVLEELNGDSVWWGPGAPATAAWECLQRDFYERAAFYWRDEHWMRPHLRDRSTPTPE